MKGKAIFMIFLVLTIPLISSISFADIQVVYAGGEGGSEGYVASLDNLEINLTTSSPIIKFSNALNSQDFNCTYLSASSRYFCSLNRDYPTYFTNTETYGLQEFNLNNDPVNEVAYVTIVVDNRSPTVNFSVYQDPSDKKIKINFKTVDYSSQANKCSGIKSVKLFNNGVLYKDFHKWTYADDCELELNGVDTGINASGEYLLSLLVEDRADNSVMSNVKKVNYDKEPPKIVPNSIKFKNVNTGFEITKTSTSGTPDSLQKIRVELEIEDYNLKYDTVLADLSGITQNSLTKEYYRDIEFDCSTSDGFRHTCISKNNSYGITGGLELNPPNGNIEMWFTAGDTLGYKFVNQKVVKTIDIDNSKPVASFLGTAYCDNEGKCYAKKGRNAFIMKADIGTKTLARQLISFDLSGFMNTNSYYQVQHCESSGSLWTCYSQHSIQELDEGRQIQIGLVKAFDDLGNRFEDKFEIITYDSEKPYIKNEIKDIKFFSRNPWIEIGDRVSIEMTVYDDVSGVKTAFANLTNVHEGKQAVEGDCNPTGKPHEYKCYWDSSVQALNNGILPVNFKVHDFAGNILDQDSEVEILLVSDESLSFWSFADDVISPEKLDLVTLPFFPADYVSVYVTKQLIGASDAKTLSIDFAGSKECVLTYSDGNVSKVFKDAKIFRKTRAYVNGDKVLFEIMLNKLDLPSDTSLSYVCPLSIVTAFNGYKYAPQKTNMTFEIPTYTSQYKAGQAMKDKIDDLKEEIEAQAWIDTLMGIIEMLQKMCQIFGMMNSIFAAYSVAVAISADANPIPAARDIVQTAVKGSNFLVSLGYDTAAQYVEFSCKFIECNLWSYIVDGDESKTPSVNVKEMIIFAITGITTDSTLAGLQDSLGGSYYEISKKSILYSIIFLCIPGFIYNLKQKRNIDCQYVYCLETQVVQNGMQPYACEGQKSYATCLFVYGQIFNSMPFSIVLNMFSNMIKLFAQNPIALAYGAVKVVCNPWVMGKISATIPATCNVVTLAEPIIKGVTSLLGFVDMFMGDSDDVPQDYCEKISTDEDGGFLGII